MKEIPLTQGQVALVLDEHYDEQNQYKWMARWDPGTQTFYASRHDNSDPKRKLINMHREILKAPPGVRVDHADHNGLHNYPPNIRLATGSQNGRNQEKHGNNTSGFKGVSWSRTSKKWVAQICVNWKVIGLGYFDFAMDAAEAYNEASLKYSGEFSVLNKIPNEWTLESVLKSVPVIYAKR